MIKIRFPVSEMNLVPLVEIIGTEGENVIAISDGTDLDKISYEELWDNYTSPDIIPYTVETYNKLARANEVNNIIVTISKGNFNGDEDSQNRLSRALNMFLINPEITEIPWKSADNIFISLTKSDIEQILVLAGSEQIKIWEKYN
jgi:hypothetical protein